jgi:hypothetical protein
MKKLLKDSLTGKDNHTYDIGRISCFLSFLVYFILALASCAYGHPWSAMDFSAGCGTMAVGFGANLVIKRSTEPSRKKEGK